MAPPRPLTWVIPCCRDLALMLPDDAEKPGVFSFAACMSQRLYIRIGEVAARCSAAYGFRLISPQRCFTYFICLLGSVCSDNPGG